MISDHMHSVVKAGLDVGSLGVLTAWWAGVAPAIATTLTIIWVGYCICEAAYHLYKKFKENKGK